MARTKTPKKKKQTDPDLNENNLNDNTTSTGQEPTSGKNSSIANSREEKLKQDGSYIVLPDVSNIPGQENIVNAGIPGEMGDTTAASDDEEGIREGTDIFEEEDDVNIVMGTDADVTAEDLETLGDPDKDMDMNEDEFIRNEGLDDTDTDGDPLNEAAVDEDSTGDDLDVPEEDNNDPRKESMTEDDEENNYYSLGSGDNDELNEGRKDE